MNTTLISNDDIKWAYNILLKRDPESIDVYKNWIMKSIHLKDLIEHITQSYEYKKLSQRDPLSDVDVVSNDTRVQTEILMVLRKIRPMKVLGFNKTRVGGNNDGGYIMLDDFLHVKTAYSLGIFDDVKWDIDIANKGIQVYQYDHTIDKLPQAHSLFKWFKLRVDGIKNRYPNSITLEDAVNINSPFENNIILKCDIENSEWDVFANLDDDIIVRFKQIVIEIHSLQSISNLDFRRRANEFFEKMNKFHTLIHLHANNNGAYNIIYGMPIPDVIELTYIRTDEKEFEIDLDTFPTSIDQPNSLCRIDYFVGGFKL